MSKIPFHSRLLKLADLWRAGAVELRDQFREPGGKVPFSVEVGANGLEVCAERLEREVREELVGTRSTASQINPAVSDPVTDRVEPVPTNPHKEGEPHP